VVEGEAGNSATAAVRWNDALASVSEGPESTRQAVEPSPEDPMMVIYTSGTTGLPKGIEYSHAQIMTACWAMVDTFPDIRNARLVCWLPMAALFQRMMNLLAFATRSATYIVEDPREIMARLPEIRPTVLTAVPRFYEKLHAGIRDELGRHAPWKQRIASWALSVGRARSAAVRSGSTSWTLRLKGALADRLVLRRLRAVMGGELRWMVSGSASTGPRRSSSVPWVVRLRPMTYASPKTARCS
jgi:long-chain acyl-CoA synthetase